MTDPFAPCSFAATDPPSRSAVTSTLFLRMREPFGELLNWMTTPFHEAFRVLSRVEVPIVTAAQGAIAGGGLGFVYAADLVVAAEDTKFLTAFAGLGLSGDGGGTWHLPRLIGARRAAQAYLRKCPSRRARRWNGD